MAGTTHEMTTQVKTVMKAGVVGLGVVMAILLLLATSRAGACA